VRGPPRLGRWGGRPGSNAHQSGDPVTVHWPVRVVGSVVELGDRSWVSPWLGRPCAAGVSALSGPRQRPRAAHGPAGWLSRRMCDERATSTSPQPFDLIGVLVVLNELETAHQIISPAKYLAAC